MKLTILIFALFLGLTACSAQKVESQKSELPKEEKTENRTPNAGNQTKKYVLVELFTSEGCSSCPPADKVLARLESEQPVKDVEIVPLALHVDYWNYLGWRDEFSSAAYSARQSGYADKFKLDSIYTPQMIIDGSKQFVGSQFDTAVKSVKETAQAMKSDVEIRFENNELKVEAADLPKHETAYVWLAVTEDNLQTDVRRGENSGKKLSHTGVVRELRLLGNLRAEEKSFAGSENFSPQPGWKKENINLIIFIQEQNSKNVIAVGKIKLV